MSKRARESSSKKPYNDPFFDDDDSGDDDYVPSDEEDEGRIDPNQHARERVPLPDHLDSLIKEKDLNKIHFEIITSTDLNVQDDKINWHREKSVLLTQNCCKLENLEKKLVKTYATHISSFSEDEIGASQGTSSVCNTNEEEKREDKKDQVLLGILCRNKSGVDIKLKFSIDGKELIEMETDIPRRQQAYIHGYNDMLRRLSQKLLINRYIPPAQSSTNQTASSSSEETEFGIIKIEVFKADRKKVPKEDSDCDEMDDEEEVIDPSIGKLEKVTSQTQTQSNKQQKRCGMQVSYQSTKIQRPKKKVKKRRAKTEIRFLCGKLLFESVYKYRNYLGFLCELKEHNIDLKKVSNTAKGRGAHQEENHSSSESDSGEVKKEEEDVVIDITEEEPEKVIPTVSLESDDEEEDIKPNVEMIMPKGSVSMNGSSSTPKASASINHVSEYNFSERAQDVHTKSVEGLRLFIKLNDEELYTSIRNLLNTNQISGSKFMSLTPLDFNEMGVGVKDQIKILQITKKIHDNSH